MFKIKIIDAKIKPKNPILIEGLPGIGNVSRIAADYLIGSLKAKKFMELYSDCFPNSVLIDDSSRIELPKLEFYYKKTGKKQVVIMIGDVQPVNEKDSYALCSEIIKIAKKMKTKEIITLGGIGLSKSSKEPDVHGAVTDKKYAQIFKKYGVKFDGNKVVGIIVGAAGLILALGELEGIKGIALLAETLAHPDALGIHASRSLIKVLVKYLNLKVNIKELDSEIKKMESNSKSHDKMEQKLIKLITKQDKDELRYIG